MGPEKEAGNVPPGRGSLYMCTQNAEDDKMASTEVKFDQIDISNGLEWSLDSTVFYYIDSLKKKVVAFDFNMDSGNLTNKRTIYDSALEGVNGFPDGMTIDIRGHLWVAFYGGACVSLVNYFGPSWSF